MHATHSFHHTLTGHSYTLETDGPILIKATVSVFQQKPVVHDRPGHPVTLHDIVVNINESLQGKSSKHPEFQAIIAKVTKSQFA